jgi:hypothetical protein
MHSCLCGVCLLCVFKNKSSILRVLKTTLNPLPHPSLSPLSFSPAAAQQLPLARFPFSPPFIFFFFSQPVSPPAGPSSYSGPTYTAGPLHLFPLSLAADTPTPHVSCSPYLRSSLTSSHTTSHGRAVRLPPPVPSPAPLPLPTERDT